MLTLSEPKLIEHAPYHVVGAFHEYHGEDEGPGWDGAFHALMQRQAEIRNRTDDLILGFLYRPFKDNPRLSPEMKACFVGVDVADFEQVPDGMATTTFSGGTYAVVEIRGDIQDESTEGVGTAITYMGEKWIPEHGYSMGDACFACSPVSTGKPPFIEYVYVKLEKIPQPV